MSADEGFGADAYYDDESEKTQESHWNLLASSGVGDLINRHMLSIAYRGREDMTMWADGRLGGGGRSSGRAGPGGSDGSLGANRR